MKWSLCSSIEMFNGTLWTALDITLTSPRGHFQSVFFEGCMVVVGGDSFEIEVYDIEKKEWRRGAMPELSQGRMSLAALVY
jgi:hypothetical protein